MAEMLEENLNITVNITNADWAIFYEDILAGNYEVAQKALASFLSSQEVQALLKELGG